MPYLGVGRDEMDRKHVIGAVFALIFLASIVSVTAAATQSIFLNPSDPNGQGGNSATQVYASNTLRMTARTTVQVNSLILYEDGNQIADLQNHGGCAFGNCWVVMDITKNRAAIHTYTASASNGVDTFINVPAGGQNMQWLNNLPTAVPGGPYSGNEGSPITFDGSNSYDHSVEMAHGSIITRYEWDWENDGTFDTSSSAPTAQHTWPDDYSGTVALRVTDSDNGQNIATAKVTVNNVAPTAGASASPNPVNEGSATTITGSQTDPGADTFTYSFDWDNDGNYEIVDQQANNAQYTWNDNGVYTVGVRVRDDDGGVGTTTTQVTVNDLSPTGATVSGNLGPTEGVQETYSAAPLPNPYTYPDAITGYEWDWEYDGSTFVPSGDTGSSASHIYNNNGTFTIAVRVTDDDGSTAIGTLGVTVSDVSPSISSVTGSSNINEGDPATFTVTATEGNPSDAITSYDWDFDNDGTYDLINGGSNPTTSFYMDNGTYTITVRVNDEDSSVTDSSHAIVVNDLGPTASFNWSPATPDEAQTVTFTDTSTSFPDTIVTWLWSFGDGTPTSSLQNPTHSYADNGTYSLTLTVTDDDGTQHTDSSQSINVNNVVPTDPTTLTPTTGVYGGTNNIVSVSCSGSTDADSLVYDIEALYGGSWNSIFTGVTGTQSWDVSGISTQPGVDLRCRAMDTDNYYSGWFNPPGTLTVDNTVPVAAFAPPTPADTSRQVSNQVTINVTVTDQITLVDTCTLDWNDGTTHANYTMTNSSPDSNGVYYCTRTMSTVDGSAYTYTVYANDTANNIGSASQRSFTENSIPSSSTPTLTPASPTTTSVVTCSVNYADSESDAGSVHFTWYNNNQVLTTNTNSSVVSGSNVIDTLASGNFVKNDVIVCEVWSNDGYEDEAKQNSTGLAIGNTAPAITTTPATITKNADGTQMAYDFNATDIDVTELVDTLTWSINDTRLNVNSSTGLVTDTPIESEQGTYTVLVTVSDGTAQANHAFQYVIVDVTPPTTTDNYVDSAWKNSAQTITLTCSDNGVGCSTTMYCVDQSDTCTPNTVYSGPVTITNNDTNYIRYASNDTNNNWESVNSKRVRVDMVAPTISDDFANDGIWLGIANGSQTVTLTPSDNTLGSGIASVSYCTGASCTPGTTLASPYQLNYSAQQNTIVRYQATDIAGNPSSIGQYTVMIDLTAPAVNHNNTFDGVWRPSGYTILHTATDTGGSNFGGGNGIIYRCSGAGCTPTSWAFSPSTVQYGNNNMVQTYRYMTYDNASNPSPIVEYTVQIDVTNPNLWLVSPVNASYSNTNPTNFTVYAMDNYDTSMTCESYINGSLSQTFTCLNGTQTVFQEALADGNHTWQVVLKDNATNSNTSAIWNLTVDTVAPTSTANGYTPGWVTTSPVMITLSATDPAPSSGLPPISIFPFTTSPIRYCTTQNCTPNNLYIGPFVMFSTDGTHYLSHRAVDNANNWEATQQKVIRIDTVAPAFSSHAMSPSPPNEDQDVTINVTVTEATSGLASVDLVLQGSTTHPATNVGGNVWQVTIGQGNYSARQNINYYWTATDVAGNTNNSANQAFSVVNQAPYLNPAPSINDTAPYTFDTLYCNAGTFQDDDAGDTQASASFMWLRNGAQIAGQTTQTLDLSQAGNGDRGDIIICSQQVSDGFANSAWHNSSPVTVQNYVPTVPTSLTPATGLYGGTSNIVPISCSGSTDADPTDTVSYDIDGNYSGAWNNVVSGDADGNFNWDVSSIATQAGVDLQCRGTDGTAGSSYYNPAGTLSIDNTAPTTTDDYTQSSVWQSSPQTVTLTCTDTGAAGCGTTLYCVDQTNTCVPGTAYTAPVTITSNGTNYIRYHSSDALNNQEAVNIETVMLDMIAPTIADNYAFNGIWTNIVPQTVTLAPADTGGSGIATVRYCTGAAPCNPATGTVLAAPYQLPQYATQQNTFTNYQAWDGAGNPSAVGQFQAMIDLTVPTITDDYALDGVWTSTSPQTVTLSPADTGGSGVNQVLVCVGAGCVPNVVVPAPYVTNHTGDQNIVVRYMADDVATNPSSIGQYTVMIDTTPPAIALNSPANGTSTNNNNVTFSWTATDNYATSLSCTLYVNGGPVNTAPCTSGVASTYNANMAPGQYTWHVTATDHLNLTGASGTNGLTVDNTAPNMTGSWLEGGWVDTSSDRWMQTPNHEMVRANGIASETVSWTGIDVEDSNSTVVHTFANVSNNQTITTAWWNASGLADGQYTIRATMTDLAGNPSTALLGSFYVDNTAPSYTAYSITPADVKETHTGSVAVSVDATDSGAGVDTTANGTIWYRYNSSMAYASVPLVYQSGSTWSGTIPATDWNAQRGNTMDAYAEIQDNVGNMVPSAVQSELIDHVNDAPVMNVGSLNGMTLAEDTSTTVDLTTYATDEEDSQSSLVWNCTSDIGNVPVFVTNRVLNITGMNDYNGMVTVSCTVADTNSATDAGSFSVNVTPVNDPPVLTQMGTQLAFVLETYSGQMQASDPADGDTLTFTDNTNLFDIGANTGLISFTPTLAQKGEYMVNLTATDGQYMVDENVNFTVYVRHDTEVTNIAYSKAGTDVYIGDSVQVNATVTNIGYTAETFNVNLRDGTNVVSTQQLSLVPGQSQVVTFTWNPSISGYRTVSVQAATVSGEGDATNNVQYLNNIRVWAAGQVIDTSKFKPGFNPDPVNQSSLFTLRYRLNNINVNKSFASFPVTITLPTGFVLVGSTQQYHNMAPGYNAYQYFNVTSPAVAGNYTVIITAGNGEYSASDVIEVL